MLLKECYERIGGDYDGVLSRMISEATVKKFVVKFLSDKSYDLLISSLENADLKEAFRAAHTLKGICQNLGFNMLFGSVDPLTESLRDADAPPPKELVEAVKRDYEKTVSAIAMLDE